MLTAKQIRKYAKQTEFSFFEYMKINKNKDFILGLSRRKRAEGKRLIQFADTCLEAVKKIDGIEFIGYSPVRYYGNLLRKEIICVWDNRKVITTLQEGNKNYFTVVLVHPDGREEVAAENVYHAKAKKIAHDFIREAKPPDAN